MNNKTTLTGIHIKLIEVCDQLGLEHREEENFGKYFIDVYLPEFHLGLEADGPYHLKKHDKKRDNELWEVYALPLARYHHKKMKTLKQMEEIKWQIHQEILKWSESASQRMEMAKLSQQQIQDFGDLLGSPMNRGWEVS